MKKLRSLCGYSLLCSLIVLFSCTKNNEEVRFSAISVNANSNVSAGASGMLDCGPGDSLVVKGDTSNGDETVLLQTFAPDTNRVGFVSFTALSPQLSGNGGIDRSIMKFKLRHISDSLRNNPPQIKKAVLYLYQYHRPADQDPYSTNQIANNSAELHRIVSNWESSTVTWNLQPVLAKGSANPLEDVVAIPPVATPLPAGEKDNQVIDITDMVRKIIASRNNQGFLLKLTNENKYAGRAYGSMTCPELGKRPKLVLYF